MKKSKSKVVLDEEKSNKLDRHHKPTIAVFDAQSPQGASVAKYLIKKGKFAVRALYTDVNCQQASRNSRLTSPVKETTCFCSPG